MLIIFILNSNKLWVVDTFKDLCHFQWCALDLTRCSSLLNGNFVNLGMSWMIFRIYEIFLNTCTYMYIYTSAVPCQIQHKVSSLIYYLSSYQLQFACSNFCCTKLLEFRHRLQCLQTTHHSGFDDRPSVVSFGFSLSKNWQCMQWYWLSTAWSLSEFL